MVYGKQYTCLGETTINDKLCYLIEELDEIDSIAREYYVRAKHFKKLKTLRKKKLKKIYKLYLIASTS